MKKSVLLLALILLFTCVGTAFADDFDLTYVREKPDWFTIDVNVEENLAFIESTLSTADRSFIHKYDSTTRYSATQFDLIVLNYLDSTAYPVFRLWISYSADDSFMNISSVSFVVDGQKYTFSDVANTERYYQDENGYTEQLLIKFGDDNLEFLVALEQLLPETYDELQLITVPMTLHGRENITAELGVGFLMDFLMIKNAYVNSNGLSYLSEANATPMKVTAVSAAQ